MARMPMPDKSKAMPKKRLTDKYGRSLTVTEAAKRKAYRERLSQMTSPAAAAAARKKEMERRAKFRKTTSLKGAKGPGKAQAQLEARRMAGRPRSAGASSSEAMRMGRAAVSAKSRRGL